MPAILTDFVAWVGAGAAVVVAAGAGVAVGCGAVVAVGWGAVVAVGIGGATVGVGGAVWQAAMIAVPTAPATASLRNLRRFVSLEAFMLALTST